ncbi:MAG: hypothetical protein FWE02_07070 [Defluviitaleaceae bacterium]|nr:hypothetical protein [Defluviitaleaceae bacterium]
MYNKRIIEDNLIEESLIFFKEAEKIKNKEAHVLYIQIIASTIADGFDFITLLLKNKYFKKQSQIDESLYKNIFKWNAFYITSIMLREKYYRDNKEEIRASFFKVFKISKKGQKKLLNFFELCESDYQKFVLDFSKYIIKNIKIKEKNAISLALSCNFFYNSYIRFINECSDYLKKAA